MKEYKGVLVGKGSALYDALQAKDEKLAKKIFGETTERYKALYSKEDRDWFASWTNVKVVNEEVE